MQAKRLKEHGRHGLDLYGPSPEERETVMQGQIIMEEHERWQWQEPGTAWKGAGLYHITLTATDRRPVLGLLDMPEADPTKAIVRRTALGDALVDCLLSIPSHHPEVRVLHFCLMPDHLHAVLYVQRTMPQGIRALVRGFWQAVKKLGRAWTAGQQQGQAYAAPSSIPPNAIRGLKDDSARLTAAAVSLRQALGDEAYYGLEPVFREMPFIRPMTRYSQLQTAIRYIDMNPQRLATKRLRPGLFRVQKGIAVGGRSYDGVGNATLLMRERFATVHVRQQMVKQAEQGNSTPLRNYMNSCVLQAREGVVMVSPFISTQEKQVQQVLQREQKPLILLSADGFRDYYKPADVLFDACAAGRLLILSPWPYDDGRRHISRADCVALNAMAEEICNDLNNE